MFRQIIKLIPFVVAVICIALLYKALILLLTKLFFGV